MSRRVSRAVAWLVVLVLFAIAGLLLSRDVTLFHQETAHSRIAKPAPDATIFALDGRPTRLAAFKGHPLWLNFFASWCPPCKVEMPDIEIEYRTFHRGGLEVLGIDQQEPSALVAAFVRPFRLTFPVMIDAGALTQAYQVHAIPTSVFIDRHGFVRAMHTGAMTRAQMETDLKKIM